MTLHHFLRTLAIASLGLAALGSLDGLRAEGGEGANVVPPEISARETAIPLPRRIRSKAASISPKPAPLDKIEAADDRRWRTSCAPAALKPLVARYRASAQGPVRAGRRGHPDRKPLQCGSAQWPQSRLDPAQFSNRAVARLYGRGVRPVRCRNQSPLWAEISRASLSSWPGETSAAPCCGIKAATGP